MADDVTNPDMTEVLFLETHVHDTKPTIVNDDKGNPIMTDPGGFKVYQRGEIHELPSALVDDLVKGMVATTNLNFDLPKPVPLDKSKIEAQPTNGDLDKKMGQMADALAKASDMITALATHVMGTAPPVSAAVAPRAKLSTSLGKSDDSTVVPVGNVHTDAPAV